ncbi:hypothetical protein FACS189472_05240 [Alphaproteobacteria bacterium]|nr:hypothetical protein FACS189472_05240 [Alphaproteobacteria bacterium]
MQFNELKFLTEVQRIHLNQEEIGIYKAIQKSDVRSKLNNFVDYGNNPRFSAALDAICENLVGRTIFELLITKMIAKGKKMRIVAHNNQNEGSSYDNYVVYINLSRYDKNKGDVGIESMQYYCVNADGKIEIKLKSLAESIFHEFCHALHEVSGTYTPKVEKKCRLVLAEDFWTNDEELRTICCLEHDPICDHCFDLIMSGDSFRPRYGHGGFTKGERSEQDESEERKKIKKHLLLSQKFMDGWKEYVV